MRPRAIVARVLLVIALLLSIVIVACAVAQLFPAGTNMATLLSTMVWAYAGPHLLLASLVIAAFAIVSTIRSRRRLSVIVSAFVIVALVSSSVIVGSIGAATLSAGGSINPITAITLESADRNPDEVVTYATVDGTALTAQVFRPAASDPAPIIVYIHGGGWRHGSAKSTAATARWYSAQGFVVVNVNYRLADPETATWDEAPADIGCALAWSAANVSTLGGDASRLSVMGDSAGGNLSIAVAWAASVGEAESSCPELGAVPVPDAAVGTYPVIDPENTYDEGRDWLFGQSPKDFTEEYLGGTPAEHPDRLAAISPLTFASGAAPDTLIVEPMRDDFVPAQGVIDVVDAARAAGVPVTLAEVPFTHHAFDVLLGSLGDQAKRSIVMSYLAERGLAP